MGTYNLLEVMRIFNSKFSSLDSKVLGAIKRVDRKLFLDDTIIGLLDVDGVKWFEAEKEYREAVDKKREIPDKLRRALDELFGSYKVYNAEVSGLAYSDQVLPIRDSQTCSQPSVVAFMSDILQLEDGLSVLEGGTGCGYHAAVTYDLIANKGRLTSVEINPRLKQTAVKNLKAQFGDGIEQRISIIEGDVMETVRTEQQSFDRIYFTFAVDLENFDLGSLVSRLRDGSGIILLPERRNYLLRNRYKQGAKVEEEKHKGYNFVPMQNKIHIAK